MSYNMSSCGPLLPNEIFFSIIEHAAEDNETSKATLKASSLVNRDFASFCQSHIFRQITIGVCGPLTSKRKELVRILSQSPHLATFIKDVRYVLESTEPSDDFE
ncbi:hypothetical protein BJ165DRAFT_674864 [Panaeolus papilionaceus]|nr:hypothetical protein BJ165DRAFT_674864 [Panaeolus papilionaceus]